METIKSYTDLKQSKKLTEILPLESADMYYREWKRMTKYIRIAYVGSAGEGDLPCWSLAALLDIIPNVSIEETVYKWGKTWFCTSIPKDTEGFESNDCDNPIDACYEMIIKLHELNLL